MFLLDGIRGSASARQSHPDEALPEPLLPGSHLPSSPPRLSFAWGEVVL